MESHDYYTDAQGQAQVNISARPRLAEFKNIGKFGVALERWAHEEEVSKRSIGVEHDVVSSAGQHSDIFNEIMRRLEPRDG